MIKVRANEKLMYVGKNAGDYMYVMTAERYSTLGEDKLMEEAATHSGLSKAAIRAAWGAATDVLRNWLTEGHTVKLPGIGTMRFGLNAKAVAKVDDVSANLITSKKIIFTPDVDIKQALQNTEISITCYDRSGNVVKV